MASLHDLPLELLFYCVDLLSGYDIKNLLVVSKNLNEKLKSRLCRKVAWACHSKMWTSVPEDDVVVVDNGHAFCKKVNNDDTFARMIGHIDLESSYCLRGDVSKGYLEPGEHHEQTVCEGMNSGLIDKMKCLLSLKIAGSLNTVLKGASIPPELTSLHIENVHPSTSSDLMNLILSLYKTKVKFLTIERMALDFKDEEWPKINSEMTPHISDPANHVQLQKVVLNQVDIRADHLNTFLERCHALKHFAYVAPYFASDSRLTVSKLGMMLRHFKHSLQELIIAGLHEFDWRERSRIVLELLTSFGLLRSLTIDPGLFLGYRNCAHKTATPANHLRDLSEFAAMLPVNLEDLRLLIDMDQARRVGDYIIPIIGSILEARKKHDNLRELAFVRVIEFYCFSNWRLCYCHPDDCYNREKARLGDCSAEKAMGMTAEQTSQFRVMQVAYKEIGIALEHYDSDCEPDDAIQCTDWLQRKCAVPG